MSALEELLRGATLALTAWMPDGADAIEGTGFLVAPGIVATCAHVLAERREKLPATVAARTATGRELVLETAPEWYLRDHEGGLDLAFLRASLDAEVPHVLLSDVVETGETLWTFGHPAGKFRFGQSAQFTAQGSSLLRAVDSDGLPLGDEWQPKRVFGTPVGGGYSGSAVLSRRTGAVCGMLFSAGKGGSAHMVSAGDIISALPQIAQLQSDPARNNRWLEQLDDEQILNGGWPYPGPRLRRYLKAAIDKAQTDPYPGMPDTRPQLTRVHLRQQVQPSATGRHNEAGTSSPGGFSESPGALPAQEVLDQDGDVVLIAGPGGGKSTLLRMGLITLAERWRAGHAGRWIPVYVPAAHLALPRPLHEAIADSVTADLNVADPTATWSASFFETAALRGVCWLVMVDGLDEITDVKARRKLVTKLANESAKPDSPYRFVATTRPLSRGELVGDVSGSWIARRYKLLPFSSDDLQRFAEQWFAVASGLPQPGSAAQQFSDELQRRGLEDLARVPLMITLLCQLYVANPGRPLPDRRSEIYQEFLAYLNKRQRAAGLRDQTRAALHECGEEAVTAAEKVLEHLQDLIAFLAAERRLGNGAPALDLIASQPEAALPKHVTEAEWRTFLEESLRTSGLLIMRAGEAVFLHQTLLEYLAARHVTRDESTRVQAYKTLFQLARYGPRTDMPSLRPRIWGRRFWRSPGWESYMYVGILLELGVANTSNSRLALERLLKRLAGQGGLSGATFISWQKQLGTRLPDSVIQAALGTLSRLARSRRRTWADRKWAAEEAFQLDHERGISLFESLALDRVLDFISRWGAARVVVELEHERGVRLFDHLAGDPTLDTAYRMMVAEELTELDHERGIDRFDHLARDSRLEWPFSRWEATQKVVELDQERGADLLDHLARDRNLYAGARVDAARALGHLGDPRSVGLLDHLARNPDLHWVNRRLGGSYRRDREDARVDAARALADLGDRGGTDLLGHFACNARFSADVRVRAARELANVDHRRGADLLDHLACDPHFDGYSRVEAARALAHLGDQRGADLLKQLAHDPTLNKLARRLAAT
ncbi:trypsin-like peptidase domain-containing protein [Streptomyces sp. NPDC001178]